ncbi:anti-sigma-F factor Fin family protein [Bacillus fonticola]|uniref:anti-sigma-F factor Fin family protein n=1 Tax=Bacillus fonticola TaxID=2728853 RepID=UPI0014766F67|nr:anti-sigma-F factor Fin family protein [Bacillus fonticola]
MALHYVCRHCQSQVGTLDQERLATTNLGFDVLTNAERQNMISFMSNGDLEIKTICEECQEALDQSPHYHEQQTFLQ